MRRLKLKPPGPAEQVVDADECRPVDDGFRTTDGWSHLDGNADLHLAHADAHELVRVDVATLDELPAIRLLVRRTQQILFILVVTVPSWTARAAASGSDGTTRGRQQTLF